MFTYSSTATEDLLLLPFYIFVARTCFLYINMLNINIRGINIEKANIAEEDEKYETTRYTTCK